MYDHHGDIKFPFKYRKTSVLTSATVTKCVWSQRKNMQSSADTHDNYINAKVIVKNIKTKCLHLASLQPHFLMNPEVNEFQDLYCLKCSV
jgi:hypothetical protein